MSRSWILTHYARPMTANKYRTLHHQVRLRYDREWREAFFALALEAKVPPLEAIRVTAQQTQAKGKLPDPMSCTAAVKAGVDGLVDAGVIPDDTGEYLRSVVFVPAVREDKDSLMMIIEEVER